MRVASAERMARVLSENGSDTLTSCPLRGKWKPCWTWQNVLALTDQGMGGLKGESLR